MLIKGDVDAARGQIGILIEERSFTMLDEGRIDIAPHGRGTEDGFHVWSELSREQQVGLLTSKIEWLGFQAPEIELVIRRVVEGESMEFWFDDIQVSDAWERREEQFAEWREDAQAARERDESPPPWKPELDAMMEAVGNPSNFREPWTEADKLRAVEETWDWSQYDHRQKEAALAGEIDFSKITRDHINEVYERIGSDEIDERPARRLFDEANYARAVIEAERIAFEDQFEMVRPTTRNLIESMAFDTWPRAGAIVDFGIESQRHYEALHYPIRNDEIMPLVLDAAMGNGAKLTELVRGAESNPHKDIEFHTSWDVLLGREKPGQEAREPSEYEKAIQQAADMAPARGNDKDRGGPER